MIAVRRLLYAVILSALVGIVLGVPSAAAQQVPNTPDPPSVVAKSKTALTVTWTAPTGPAVASYDVQYRKSTETNWTAGPQDQTGTRADITGLDADTFYDVQVRATNAAGNSGWSDDAQGATALFEADLTSAGTAMADSHIRLAIDADTLLPARIFIRRMRWVTGC